LTLQKGFGPPLGREAEEERRDLKLGEQQAVANSPSLSAKQLIVRNLDGSTEGVSPHSLSADELRSAGHLPAPILQVIRHKCIDCSGGSISEARRCTAIGCDLWPYRMGTNPFRRGMTNAGAFGAKKDRQLPGNSTPDGILEPGEGA
jgi:hypothetical protein